MLADTASDFRGLALAAFRASAPEFSDEDLRWEPALRGIQYWREIEPMLLNPMDALMLSEQAFLFCLPAYMIGSLYWEHFFVDSILKLLYTPGSPWESWNRSVWWHDCKKWDHLMSKLTQEQKHVVCVWLVEIGALYPNKEVAGDYGMERLADRISRMLGNYWAAY